ncbi:MAG: alpha/beta fold hydrolase [Deltaproteobacteria bacterium]|nr:alpha/beta fold hydrolase [Deltaproteobacteria bacterium]
MTEAFEIRSNFNKISGVITRPCSGESPTPLVILSHGLLSSKDSTKYIELAQILAKEGITSIRFDYHGCGNSGGKIEETSLTKRLENLETVFEFGLSMDSIDKTKVGILGSSFGGVTAILKAAKDKRVKALVILATPYALRRSSNEISGVRFPDSFFEDFLKYDILTFAESVSFCLVLHGKKDDIVPYHQAQAIYERLKEPKHIEIINEADHTFSHPEHRKIVMGSAISWFKKYLF